MGADRFDLRRLLAAVEQASPVDVVDVVGAELARSVDASDVSLLIANFSGEALERMSSVEGAGRDDDGRNERTERVPLAGSVHEQVLFSQEPTVIADAGTWRALLPITERGDAIGVMEATFAERPADDVIGHLVAGAHALAYVLVSARRHTDLFEWAQRDTAFSVSAEIQRRLLPSAYSFEAGPVSLAGWLEPSHDAGGDTFDYSLDRDHVYVSVTDAMGHSVAAAMLATLTVGTLRNERRALAAPGAQADAAGKVLRQHAKADEFVTGLLVRIRLADGTAEVVNAGHPAPFLLRHGQLAPLGITVQPPLGVTASPYVTDHVALEPGDRLLVLTDGYLERSARRVNVEEVLVAGRDRNPRQVVRELARNLLEATGSRPEDDATALCLDWFGPEGVRAASGGASQSRATPT